MPSEEECRREAARVEAENPRWLIVYGVHSHQFVCFPLFDVPRGTLVIAEYPGALPGRLRDIEKAYLRRGW
jgi:hypothetical protein